MSRFRRFDIVEHCPSSSSHILQQTSIFAPPKTLIQTPYFLPSIPIFEDELEYSLTLPHFPHLRPALFDDEYDAVSDLIQIDQTPFRATSARRVTRRVGSQELYLQALCDRVADLELGFDRIAREERLRRRKRIGDRKYTWTAEIGGIEVDRKYKWAAEIKDEKKAYKWTAQIKGKGGKFSPPIERTYTVKVQSGDHGESSSGSDEENDKKKKKDKKKKSEKVKEKGKSNGRIVEIDELSGNRGVVLRQALAKRMEKKKGKRKDLSPQDAAALIQMNFRAYLIRRSQALRALRELAIAKTKLKEIRALFNNFSYRRRLSMDAEERQRFSEKIIVLLLTVDAIEGSDPMVRVAKKLIVDELEAMLDVVDPQPVGRSLSMRRRTFDMPDGMINKELAAGVAQVVQMLDQEPAGSESFEACL